MTSDTPKLARTLREAGFNEAQAEAVADAMREGTAGADLVTKSDLALRTAELQAEIAAARGEFKAEIAALKSELPSRMFQMIPGAALVNAIAMAGLMFAFQAARPLTDPAATVAKPRRAAYTGPNSPEAGPPMLVEQIWTANAGRNFNYLIACPETGEALAIDPLDAEKCLAAARRRGWTIRQILNTHEHRDHTGGNDRMIAATGATLLAHANAKDRIAGIDRGLKAGDAIRVGRTVELECLDTPGHTMSHICVLAHGDTRALFCGDTLFNAGAGNCHNGGHPHELYNTFATQLSKLPDDTLVYPGHDYICNNLRFTLDREPDNARAQELLQALERQDTNHPLVTTLGMEKEINTFFRLTSPSVIRRLREAFPDLPDDPDQKTVFLKLRELRNKW